MTSVSVTLTTETVDFGTLPNTAGFTNDTSDSVPGPFAIRNDGNVEVNLSINATAFWSEASLNTSFYQAKANRSSEAGTFNTGVSQMIYLNLSTEMKPLIAWLNWTDSRDIVAIEINITAPADEPPATKVSDLVIVGTDT